MGSPEKKIKAGNCSATVWCNTIKKDGKDIDVKNVTIEKNYKDANAQWQSSNSFGVNDLPKVQILVRRVYEHMIGMRES